MYQIRIKIITTKGPDDKNVTVNWIYPDPNLKPFAELKNVELTDMVLLHTNESHFNLVVSRESDLALLGSLSFRFNVGPLIASRLDDFEAIVDEDAEVNGGKNEPNLVELKKEYNKCSKEFIKKEYLNVRKNLRKIIELSKETDDTKKETLVDEEEKILNIQIK